MFTVPGVEPVSADWKLAEWAPGLATDQGARSRASCSVQAAL
ncbi:hypothetical protein [Nonomuraea sp. NPDC049480]